MATIDDFAKIEMKVGRILSAEHVAGSEKLLRLMVDFGPRVTPAVEVVGNAMSQEDAPTAKVEVAQEERDVRQILSGIAKYYSPDELVGRSCPFVTNLPPRAMMGLDSNGMILAVKTEDGGAVLLSPEKEVPPGARLS